MSFRTLSNPTIKVNDVTIGIIPNSLSFKTGSGDKVVKAQSAGGGSIDIIVTENAETKISMVKFKLYNTKKNLDYVNAWSNLYSSTIKLSQTGGLTENFRDMVITTEPERSLGADGELEVEWMGAPTS